jgi:hypothetical protein
VIYPKPSTLNPHNLISWVDGSGRYNVIYPKPSTLNPHNLISKVDGSGRYNVMTTGSTGLQDQGVGLEAQNLISLLGRRQVEIGVPHHPAHRGACLQETARVRTGESAFGYRSYNFYGSGLKVSGFKV